MIYGARVHEGDDFEGNPSESIPNIFQNTKKHGGFIADRKNDCQIDSVRKRWIHACQMIEAKIGLVPLKCQSVTLIWTRRMRIHSFRR